VLKAGGRFAISDVLVRGEVRRNSQRWKLWWACIAGALGRVLIS